MGAAIVATSPPDVRGLLVATASVGGALMIAALLGLPLLAWALAVFGATYAIAVADASSIDARAPLVGAGLLVLGELVAWSLSRRRPVREDRAAVGARLTTVVATAIGSVVVASLVVAAASITSRAGLGLEAAGAAAAVGALALVTALSRS